MPREEQMACIARNGYEVLINLALVDSPGALLDEDSLVTALGLQYFHIPVVWESPQPSDLIQFFEAMQRCQNRKVFRNNFV